MQVEDEYNTKDRIVSLEMTGVATSISSRLNIREVGGIAKYSKQPPRLIISAEDNKRRVYTPTVLDTNPTSTLFYQLNDQLLALWEQSYTYEETRPAMSALYSILPTIITNETLHSTTSTPIELLKRLLDSLAKQPQLYKELPIEWIQEGGVLRRKQTMIVLTETQIRAAILHYSTRYPVIVELIGNEWALIHRKF